MRSPKCRNRLSKMNYPLHQYNLHEASDCASHLMAPLGSCGAWWRRQYHDPHPATCHLALCTVQLLFAGMHVTSKPALDLIPPFAFCTLRLLLALPFLWWLARKEGSRPFHPAELLYIPPMAVAIGIAYSFIFVCNQRSGPIATAMVQPFMPVFATALSAILGAERVPILKVVGMLVATLGCAVALRVFSTRVGPGPLDVFLLVVQASSYGVYLVLLTRALGNIRSADASPERAKPSPGPVMFLFSATLLAELGIACVGVPELVTDVDWSHLRESTAGRNAILAVLYAGIASSCFAHGLNSWAVSHVSGILPTVYSGVQVLWTMLLSYITLREGISWDQAVGAVITIFGVAVVSWVREKERRLARDTKEKLEKIEKDRRITPERRLSQVIVERRISLDAHPVVLEVCVNGASSETEPRGSLPRIDSGVEMGKIERTHA